MDDVAARSPRNGWRIAGLILVFVWFLVGGTGHFVLTKMFASVVPPYVPFAREVVLFTGVCEIVGALALLHPKLRRISGLALIVLTVCVTPVHIQMLMEAERYEALGLPVLWVRLAMQPILIWIIWVVTKPPTARSA
jgi:uncharacterized membrane protein